MPLELVVEQIDQSWERSRQGQSTFSHLHHLKISRTSLRGLQDDCAKVCFADAAHYAYMVATKDMIVAILNLICAPVIFSFVFQ